MEMEDQFGISDLRHFISRAAVGPNHFPPYPQPHLPPSSDLFPTHHNHCSGLSAAHPMIVMGRSMPATADMLHLTGNNNNNHNNNCNFHLQHTIHHPFNSDSTTTTTTTTTTAAAAAATYSGGFDVGDGSAARWPRQETLTLLEIRSRLDHKFKDANQKGPLWDEVARIMCEEHGYQRTGKKCREKFENLYKYYKKTKEGKAGRQDGKHYRFFRQLEALYGDHHNNTHLHHHHHITGNTPHLHIPNNDTNNNTTTMIPTTSDNNNNNHHNNNINASVSLSNTSDYDTSSSSDGDVGPASLGEGSGDDAKQKKMKKKEKKRGKRSWKAKIKEFIDHQMRKIMDKQEAWLEKMMNTLESRERERIEREEEWRKQEIERVDKEHKFWASERAWIEARDSALMSALEKITTTTTTRDDKDASVIGGYGSGGNLIVARDRDRDDRDHDQWLESEVTRLIQLRTSMESRFQQCGFSEEVLWEDIAAKMAYLGYDRSPIVCKEKWDYINKIFQQKDNNNNNTSIVIRDYNNNEGVNKKRKENYDEVSNNNHTHSYTTTTHHHNNDSMLYINHQMGGFNNNNNSHHNSNYEINEPRLQLNEGSSSSPSSHNSNANLNVNVNANASGGVAGGAAGAAGGGGVMNDSCIRFFLGSEGRPWLGE